MDSPNPELARRGDDALNRQDVAALQELVTPDRELERAPGLGAGEAVAACEA